ncbi:pilus assembly protein, partial [Acinetobacter baumannii]
MRPTPLRLEKSLPTSTLRWSIRNPCPRPRSGAVYPPGKEEVN